MGPSNPRKRTSNEFSRDGEPDSKKAIGTQRMTNNARPRPQPTDKTPKWKMDEFDEKQAKYSTKNMSHTELDRLTDFNSNDFDPLAALYTDKKLTTGKAHDSVAQLLRKWDLEDGNIVQKQETFKMNFQKCEISMVIFKNEDFKNDEAELNSSDSEEFHDPVPLDSEDEMRYWCFQ